MTERPVTLLAIESSCDDTSAAVLRDGQIASNLVATQAIHARYGGIVPEVASRLHQENISMIVDAALEEAGIGYRDLEAIACTAGPGLMGSLTVGLSYAKALALSLGIPFIAVDHMEAHVLSQFIDEPKPPFPFLNLTVSGGHTQLVVVEACDRMTVIGRTRDDAAGEAFDKSGKLLQLPYPAGPRIDMLAKGGSPIYPFPIPQIEGLDFSFSGLKTAILYFIRDHQARKPSFVEDHLADICASIQHAIVEILTRKVASAARQTGLQHIGISGGVAANSGLRNRLDQLAGQSGWTLYYPATQYCTDNAGMVAYVAALRYQAGLFSPLDTGPFVRSGGK